MAVLKAGGREAVTRYRILERYGEYTLVECELETGRTHQIRVYEAYRASGGRRSGIQQAKDRFGLSGQLCTQETGLTHPRTGERMIFEAPLPEYFTAVLAKLKKKNRLNHGIKFAILSKKENHTFKTGPLRGRKVTYQSSFFVCLAASGNDAEGFF